VLQGCGQHVRAGEFAGEGDGVSDLFEPKPGMYPGMSMEAYRELPAVSAGLLHKVITECPRAAWFDSWLNPKRVRDDDTKAKDAGSVAHEILLCGTEDCVQVFEPAAYPNATGPGVATGWSNKAIRQARDDCRAAGKIPVLKSEFGVIENMVDSAREFIESCKNSEPAVWAAFQPDGGASEVSMLWDDDGLLCRIRPDRISEDRKVIIDPKFSGVTAHPGEWSRKQMGPFGYWSRAAFYRRGCRMMFGTDPEYLFLVVNDQPPHLCSLVGVDPAGFEHGGMQVHRALRMWRESLERGWFPGYPARCAYPEVPPWEAARELEQSGLTADGIPYDMDDMHERKAA
jgi:hypothetical protein